MNRSRRAVLLVALKSFDVVAAAGCFAAAALAATPHAVGVEAFLSMRVKVANVLLFAILLLVWHLVLEFLGVYESKRLTRRRREVAGLLRATAAASAVVYLLAVAFRISLAHGAFLPLFFAATSVVMIPSRIVLRWLLGAARRRGRNLRHLLVVGTNRRATAFVERLVQRPELGYRLVGFVDDRDWDPGGAFERSGFHLAGDLADLPALLRREVVDEVMVFLPVKSSYALGSRIVAQCEEQGIRVTLPSCLFELRNAQATADEVETEAVVTIASGAMVGLPAALKRVLDVVISATLLVLLSPLLLGVAAVVKATSPGPVLFSQERIGRNKRRFRMLKFRTMVADAERRQGDLEHLNEASGPVFKIRHDPRITPVGAVLRKTSIDELPQLWNVLRGDLSLVGPRPLPVRDFEGFDRDWHRRRFSVRPGITCLWQIGGRSDVSFDRWMELDMEYIDTWSLWLDLKILVKTIPVVLRGTGAA